MENSSICVETQRYAVVTGGNKGIGLEICKQLASNGVLVVLTSRDEKRGLEAVEKLKQNGISENVIFHQLDVADISSIASLAHFIKTQFGKLDILVNNAGIGGNNLDGNALKIATEIAGDWPGDKFNWKEISKENYELGEACMKTNYYGAKNMIEAHLPLLHLSNSPRILNVSSGLGLLQNIPSEGIKARLNDVETLTEEKVEELLSEFLNDFKNNKLETNGWPLHVSAYKISKASLNAYTRIIANKFPTIRCNAVAPGYVKTDITGNNGFFTAEEGASFISRVALLGHEECPSGVFFNMKELSGF